MDCITKKQFNLITNMNTLWEQHVFWTRLLIISILSDLNDLEETQNRLLRNPVELGNLFGIYYGDNVKNKVTDLFTEHLKIGKNLIVASKNNDTDEINKLNTLWYDNADRIANTLSLINPYYNEKELKMMLHTHLDLTKKEVSLRLAENYSEDIKNFDLIEKEALEMANYFSNGIIKQMKTTFSRYLY